MTSADSWRKCIHPGPNVNKSPWTSWPSEKRNAKAMSREPGSDGWAAVFLAAIAALSNKQRAMRAAHGRFIIRNNHHLIRHSSLVSHETFYGNGE